MMATVLLLDVGWEHDADGTSGGLIERCLNESPRDILGVLGGLRVQWERVLGPHRGSDIRLVDHIFLLVGFGQRAAKEHCLVLAGSLSGRPSHAALRKLMKGGLSLPLGCPSWVRCTGDAVGPGWETGLLAPDDVLGEWFSSPPRRARWAAGKNGSAQDPVLSSSICPGADMEVEEVIRCTLQESPLTHSRYQNNTYFTSHTLSTTVRQAHEQS